MLKYRSKVVIAAVLIVLVVVAGKACDLFCIQKNRVKELEKRFKFIDEDYLRNGLSSHYEAHLDDMRRFYNNSGWKNELAYIAHGGGIGQFKYTNSREAIEDSIAKGFKFIELDLIETTDYHIVAAHDWGTFSKQLGLKTSSPQAKADISRLKIKGMWTPVFGDDIKKILDKNPDLFLVTDKIRNFKLLLKEIPHSGRMIVEVFSPLDYLEALRDGVRYPAYCVWDEKRLDLARRYNFPIVTMDAKRLFRDERAIRKVQELHDSGTTILLFWTSYPHKDEESWLRRYLGRTVSKIYTDKWSPLDINGR